MLFSQHWQDEFNTLDSKDKFFLEKALSLLASDLSAPLNGKAELFAYINRLLVLLDSKLSRQLSEIIQDDEFQQLEARWKALQSLISLPINYNRVKIKMLDVSWQEVSQDLNMSSTLRNSELYNLIGNGELNTLGGQPFGLLMHDHEVSMNIAYDAEYDDLFTLELLGKLGELCLCPFILSPEEAFFGEPGAEWLSDIKRVDKVIHSEDYQAWQNLRSQSSSRFLGLAMPKYRIRQAYKDRRIGFNFQETPQHNGGIWATAAFAFVITLIREYHRISWFGFLKSRWNDKFQGALLNQPNKQDVPEHLKNPLPKVRLFGQLANFYADQGFIPLSHSPLTNKYFFVNNNSVWQPDGQDNDKAITQLQTTLMCCRIAHYLKVQIREMIGNYSTAQECEIHLRNWLERFTSNLSSADEVILSKYPLQKASIAVVESITTPGAFGCEVRIKPQYQFDHFTGEVLLQTDLGEMA